jgi:hypothetical protein
MADSSCPRQLNRHNSSVDPAAIEWIRVHVNPVDRIEIASDRPWAQVTRVLTSHGVVWFKACAPVQGFEPRLSAVLFARWPDRVAEVLAHDERRGWLLLADAGRPLEPPSIRPKVWMSALSRYAELQRGEADYAADHLCHGVPDLRQTRLPERYQELTRQTLPLERAELARMRRFTGVFRELCADLTSRGIPDTIQHDDLHMANLHTLRGRLRILDWGDSSVSHPFASLVVMFRSLEEHNSELSQYTAWTDRFRDAYLEPWGTGLQDSFSLALRVGEVAHAIAWLRQRVALPSNALPRFDRAFSLVLRRAIATMK